MSTTTEFDFDSCIEIAMSSMWETLNIEELIQEIRPLAFHRIEHSIHSHTQDFLDSLGATGGALDSNSKSYEQYLGSFIAGVGATAVLWIAGIPIDPELPQGSPNLCYTAKVAFEEMTEITKYVVREFVLRVTMRLIEREPEEEE